MSLDFERILDLENEIINLKATEVWHFIYWYVGLEFNETFFQITTSFTRLTVLILDRQ